jgi:hypothetical protein
MFLVIIAKFLPAIYSFLILPLRFIIPLALIGFFVYLHRRIKAKKFKAYVNYHRYRVDFECPKRKRYG